MAEPIDPKRMADRGLRSDGMSWLTAKDGFEEAAGKIRRNAEHGSDRAELVDVEQRLRTCASRWLNEYVASWSDAKIRWERILAAADGDVRRAREQRQEFFNGLKKLRATFRRRLD